MKGSIIRDASGVLDLGWISGRIQGAGCRGWGCRVRGNRVSSRDFGFEVQGSLASGLNRIYRCITRVLWVALRLSGFGF